MSENVELCVLELLEIRFFNLIMRLKLCCVDLYKHLQIITHSISLHSFDMTNTLAL